MSDMPWLTEPNEDAFEHAGLPCRMIRHSRMGHWCGYVGVPKSHPYFGKNYNDIEADVHGGLTFGDMGDKYLPDPPDHYWLGFDCAHGCDLVPNFDRDDPSQRYRSHAYVKRECQHLAQELASIAAKGAKP